MRQLASLRIAALAAGVALTFLGVMGGCPATGGPGGGGSPVFNLPPVPVITSDATRGVAPLTVTFDSGKSTDDGVIVSRRWDFGDGASSQEVAPRHTYTTTGDFNVRLTLTDDLGATASRSVIISVTQEPVAVILVDRTTAESAPAIINFDGSTSFDPDGEIRLYRWDFGDGSTEVLPTVPHTFATPGTYRVKLTVTDDKGVTGQSTQLISIGIRTPTIELRIPPPELKNIVVSAQSPLWIQGVFESEPGVPRTIRAGLDGDRDQCESQAVFGLSSSLSIDQRFTGAARELTDAALSPDGTRLITSSVDGTLRLYDTATGGLVQQYGPLSGTPGVNCVAFFPSGNEFVYGLSDGTVVVRNVANPNTVRTFIGHTGTVTDVDVSPAGDEVASAGSDRRAIVWHAGSGVILRDYQHPLGVNGVAISPGDPNTLATACEDGGVRIFNIESGAQVFTLSGHIEAANSVAFSQSGLALLSSSDDNTARLWSPILGTLMATFSGHSGDVLDAKFSPDGQQTITGGSDGSVRIWDSVTAAELRKVSPCGSAAVSVGFTPTGTNYFAAIAAANDIQLDTDPPNGNDLNLTFPQALRLTGVADLGGGDVQPGRYFLWAEIDTDRTDPVRVYANAEVNVVEAFTQTVTTDTPQIPLVADSATVVPPAPTAFQPLSARQIFDLGPLNVGDRLFISWANPPSYGELFNPSADVSLMILDSEQRIFGWYQPGFILFSPASKLVIGHSSTRYYVVADGGYGVNVRIQRNSGLFTTRQQRIFLDFDGSDGQPVGVGGLTKIIPALDASDFNQYFAISPNWGAAETAILKQAIRQTVEAKFAGFNVVVSTSDDGVLPQAPFQTMYVGGGDPFLYGKAAYIDPRNETLSGTGITFADTIAADTIAGFYTNPVNSPADLGTYIGNVASHECGHLLGLRHTQGNFSDIMNTTPDPTDRKSVV